MAHTCGLCPSPRTFARSPDLLAHLKAEHPDDLHAARLHRYAPKAISGTSGGARPCADCGDDYHPPAPGTAGWPYANKGTCRTCGWQRDDAYRRKQYDEAIK